MPSEHTPVAWTALDGSARTLLYVIARRERDGYSTTRSDIREAVTGASYPQLTDQELLGSYQALEDAGLVDIAMPLDPYHVTADGRDLLRRQALRLESAIDTPAVDQVDALAVCPRCGNPITELRTITTTGEVTAAFCECRLSRASLNPAVTKLLDVYPLISDRDAAYYLRQAIYLLLPRVDA